MNAFGNAGSKGACFLAFIAVGVDWGCGFVVDLCCSAALGREGGVRLAWRQGRYCPRANSGRGFDFPAASGSSRHGGVRNCSGAKRAGDFGPTANPALRWCTARRGWRRVDASGRLVPALQQAVAIAADVVDGAGRAQALVARCRLMNVGRPPVADVRRDFVGRACITAPRVNSDV